MITDRDIAVRGVAEGRGDAKVREAMRSRRVMYCFEERKRQAAQKPGGFKCGAAGVNATADGRHVSPGSGAQGAETRQGGTESHGRAGSKTRGTLAAPDHRNGII